MVPANVPDVDLPKPIDLSPYVNSRALPKTQEEIWRQQQQPPTVIIVPTRPDYRDPRYSDRECRNPYTRPSWCDDYYRDPRYTNPRDRYPAPVYPGYRR